ncbi:MAG TPA: DUF2791 family P-loop domain-containing protein [Myxococcota bacterium]|nr:DUF2791 family P-loop domain-containing protein [Myxococcota bacterium]
MAFDADKLGVVGRRVRDLYPTGDGERVRATVDDGMVDAVAAAVTGQLGGKVGVAPRIFLKRLVGLLDQVEEHPDFDPRQHFKVVLNPNEMSAEERSAAGLVAAGVAGLDGIELDLDLGPDGGR